jgi:hypothetical protein
MGGAAGKTRFNLPGIPQHNIQHDHNHDPCFYTEEDCHCKLIDLKKVRIIFLYKD